VKIFLVDLVKILHSGEGGDVEQWLEPRNKLLVFAISFLFALYCFTFLTGDIICLLFIISIILLTCIFRSLLISIRKQLRTSTHNLEESKRRSSRALHGEFGFNSYFEWPLASFILSCL